MNETDKISINVLVVIGVLVFNVWWIITGALYGKLPAADFVSPWREFVYFILIASLVLIPFCVKERKWGFLAAILLGLLILLVEVYLAPIKISEGQLGGMFFGVVQVLIIIFAYRAFRRLESGKMTVNRGNVEEKPEYGMYIGHLVCIIGIWPSLSKSTKIIEEDIKDETIK